MYRFTIVRYSSYLFHIKTNHINFISLRLCLRSSLARLHAELETFRFRAIQDTQLTVDKMEQARSDYRARLLWMADVSKELDPDHYKRLDKFRDVSDSVADML